MQDMDCVLSWKNYGGSIGQATSLTALFLSLNLAGCRFAPIRLTVLLSKKLLSSCDWRLGAQAGLAAIP
jgi:hypothetical protein